MSDKIEYDTTGKPHPYHIVRPSVWPLASAPPSDLVSFPKGPTVPIPVITTRRDEVMFVYDRSNLFGPATEKWRRFVCRRRVLYFSLLSL